MGRETGPFHVPGREKRTEWNAIGLPKEDIPAVVHVPHSLHMRSLCGRMGREFDEAQVALVLAIQATVSVSFSRSH